MDEDDAPTDVAASIREHVATTIVDALRRIADPFEREHQASAAIAAASDLRGVVAAERAQAVREMKATGITWEQVAAHLGTSVPRAHQLAKGRIR